MSQLFVGNWQPENVKTHLATVPLKARPKTKTVKKYLQPIKAYCIICIVVPQMFQIIVRNVRIVSNVS